MKTYVAMLSAVILSLGATCASTNAQVVRNESEDDAYFRECQEYEEALAEVNRLVQEGKLKEAEKAVDTYEPKYAHKWSVGRFGFGTRMQIGQAYLDQGNPSEALRLFKAAKPGGGCGTCMASQHVERNIQIARIYDSHLNFPASFVAYLGALPSTLLSGGFFRVIFGLAYSGGATLIPIIVALYFVRRNRRQRRQQGKDQQLKPPHSEPGALPRILLLLAVAVAGMGFAATAAPPSAPTQTAQPAAQQAGIRYWLVVRADPRPLRFHHLEIDLGNPRLEVAAVLTADPDDAGPATAVLQAPLDIARRAAAIALVNANSWQGLADPSGKRPTNWHAGMPVEILGLAVSGGQVRSRPLDAHCGFWIDRAGRAHVGNPADLAEVREGVAGFDRLLDGGHIVPPPGGPIHPRTALGLDESGRRLVLVVVDGRQPGYSEGVTPGELAEYMKQLGCRDAVNLDGGGSSLMMMAGESGTPQVMNHPSTKQNGKSVPRPIPVALVVRARK